MTKAEAKKILEILIHADGDCPACASYMFTEFCQQWPQFKSIADEVWKHQQEEAEPWCDWNWDD